MRALKLKKSEMELLKNDIEYLSNYGRYLECRINSIFETLRASKRYYLYNRYITDELDEIKGEGLHDSLWASTDKEDLVINIIIFENAMERLKKHTGGIWYDS